MSGRRVIIPIDDVVERLREEHPGVQADAKIREKHLVAGHELCDRCNGTGNQLYAMYQRCEKCDGLGCAPYEEN